MSLIKFLFERETGQKKHVNLKDFMKIFVEKKIKSGSYVCEEKRLFDSDDTITYLQLDDKYCYGVSAESSEVFIYSNKTLKLIKILQMPMGTKDLFYFFHILNINQNLYIINENKNTTKLITFDEEGVQLHEFTLPSDYKRVLKKGIAGKLFIVSKKHIIIMDPVTTNQELIPIPADVDDVLKCCSLGVDEYCMEVKRADEVKLVKVVDGNIIKTADKELSCITSNGLGLVCAFDKNNKIMHVIGSDLISIIKFDINYNGLLYMDDACNIHSLSYDLDLKGFYIKKYELSYKFE